MNWRQWLRAAWIGGGLLFMGWIWVGFQAVDVPEDALRSSGGIRVTTTAEGGWRFEPTAPAQTPALVFLPGGVVDPVAYAPLLRRVAEAGYAAVLVPLPWRCACTEAQVSALFAAIAKEAGSGPVVLAGHSRGAMLAARYAREHAAELRGLALIATTHPRDFSLATLGQPVLKVYGTEDGVAAYRAMRENERLLPPATQWVAVEGGNHVQFGYYRHQMMDGEARISREEQQRQTALALVRLLKDGKADPLGR